MGHCYLRLSAMQCIVIAQIVGGGCAKGGKRLPGSSSLSPDPASYQQSDSKSLYWDLFCLRYLFPFPSKESYGRHDKKVWKEYGLLCTRKSIWQSSKGTSYWSKGPVTIIGTSFQIHWISPFFESLLWIICSTATNPLNGCPLLHPPGLNAPA